MRKSVCRFSVAIMLLGLSLGVASAADILAKSPPPPAAPVTNWTGFYIGANAGGAFGNEKVSATLNAPAPFLAVDTNAVSNAASPTLKPSGFTGGLEAGYNWQNGSWVFGGEADFDYLGLKASNNATQAFPSTLPGGAVGPPTVFFTSATSMSTDWLFTLRQRLGWANDNWLFFATGGLAVGHDKFNQTIALVAPTTVTTALSSTRVGWTIGAGAEYALNRSWSVKAEYLHVDLGSVSSTGTVAPPFAGLTLPNSSRLTTEIARAGLNYRL
jgi:outer membrane immunogenic protein